MLTFKKIEFENFGSFVGKHSFTYAEKGLHLITAINRDNLKKNSDASVGSGKSTLVTVLFFAIFGDTTKKISKNEIINNKIKKNLYVGLDFSVNNTDYKIMRFRKHDKYNNRLRFFEKINDKYVNISKSDNTETQKHINEVMMINESVFLRAILLNRDETRSFFDFSNNERYRLFESILQLDKLRKYHNTVKSRIDFHQKELNNIDGQIIAESKMMKFIDNDNTNKKNQIKDLKQEIDNFINNEDLLKKYTIDELVKRIKKSDEVKQWKKENDVISSEIDSLNKELNSYISYVSKDEKELSSLQPIICSNCNFIQNEQEYNNRKESLKHEIENYKSKEEVIANKLLSLQSSMHDIPRNFKYIDANLDYYKNISNEIKLRQNKIDFINNEIESKENDKKEYKKKITALMKEKKKKKEILDRYNYLEKILNIKNDDSIKQYAISKIIPIFNSLVKYNISAIFDEQIDLVVDVFFNETILYDNEEYSYGMLSTGEKIKTNLSINFSILDAIRLNVIKPSLIICDEILTNVDDSSIDAILNLIKEKYTNDMAVYIISHQSGVVQNTNFDSVTTVIKEDKCSSIL